MSFHFGSGTTALRTDTQWALQEKILMKLNAGGGGGGTGQLVSYTGAAPVAPPADPTKDSLAYKQDGTGPFYGWDTLTQTWIQI